MIHQTLLVPPQTWPLTPSPLSVPMASVPIAGLINSEKAQWVLSQPYLWSDAHEFTWLSPRFGYQIEFCYFKIMNYTVHANPLSHPGKYKRMGCWLCRAHLLCQENNCSVLAQRSGITKHFFITYCVHSMHFLDAPSHLIPSAPFVRQGEVFPFYKWGHLASER